VSKADDAITYAQGELGKPYSYGSEGPNAFDCSGLIQWVYSHVGIDLPRTAAAQQSATKPTETPRPGDLVFWGSPAHHVGLVIGGGKMIAAPHTGAKVQVQDIYGTPSGYGRVSGAGIGSSIGGAITGANAALFAGSDFTDTIVGGFRDIAIKVGFIGLGLGLLGYGVYQTFGPSIKSNVSEALS
jgi:hypothetical protein